MSSSHCRHLPERAGAHPAGLLQLARLQCTGAWSSHPGAGRHHLPSVPVPHVKPVPPEQGLHLQPAGGRLHRLRGGLLLPGPHLHRSGQHQVATPVIRSEIHQRSAFYRSAFQCWSICNRCGLTASGLQGVMPALGLVNLSRRSTPGTGVVGRVCSCTMCLVCWG